MNRVGAAKIALRAAEGKYDEAVLATHKQFDGNTAGCGPAHRASPLAGFDNIKTDKLIEVARDEAKITHYHEDAGNGCLLYTSPSPRDCKTSRMPSSA